MKKTRKLWLGGISLILLLVLSACGGKAESNASASQGALWNEERVAMLESKLEEQNTKIAELEKKISELSSGAAISNQAGGGTSAAVPGNNGSAGKGDSVLISFAQYKKIEVGMSYDEVTEILGGEGEALSETEDMVVYSYKGTGGNGGNAVLSFQGGKLLTKAQAGLQ